MMDKRIKSEKADTAEEFYEYAKDTLETLGATSPTVGEPGTIPVNSSSEFKVESVEIYNSTRTGQEILNQFPRDSNERILNSGYDRPICNFLPCSITQALGIECSRTTEEFIKPEIDIRNNPTEIPSVTAHFNPFNPRIEGDVQISAENFSEPGKVKRETVYKCSNESEEEEEVIDDSSTVTMEASHNIVDQTVDEFIDEVRSNLPGVPKGGDETATVNFRKEGTLNLLEGIIDAWVSGSMTGRITGDIDVEYKWKNSIKSESFTIDTVVNLPVKNINYNW